MLHQQRFTPDKIRHRLELIAPLVYRRRADLPPFRYKELAGPTAVPPIAAHFDDSTWSVIQPHSYWGHWGTDFVLRTTFTVPTEWEPGTAVALYLPLGDAGDFSHPEALLYIDGTPYAACDRHHQEILLRLEWCDGQSHTLALHGWTGLGGSMRGGENTQLFLRPCQLVQIHQPTRDFIITARVALGVAQTIHQDDPAHGRLLNALDAAFKLLDTRHPLGESFYASLPAAHASLRAGVVEAGRPLEVDIYAAGHAHIDVAWLWTLGQTRRKAERTFHTVLRLMEQFPEYQFTQSQPQLYDFIRQDQPELFAAIQERVRDGRWEAVGGMWVEADCNLSSGESLARQFLLGRSFFRQHFGPDAESPILWLPDVFGYAWNLPQLIKEAGLQYFFTIKIGWSQYNRMPYDSFWWQGLDGTRVLTHYSPTPEPGGRYASTYNAKAVPEDIIGTWTNFQQKEQSHDLLMAFGYGDGGGGPTAEMLENIREMGHFPAAPRIHHHKAIDFFRALEANSGDVLPTWKGELYLEYHRGTYTTQSRNKRANRKSEFLLHNAEFLAAFATVIGHQLSVIGDPITDYRSPITDYPYPQEGLRHAWELVCLNQFHDIIPGSSITAVYAESLQQYDEIRQIGEQVRDSALAAIAANMGSDLLVINPTHFSLRELLFVPDHPGYKPSTWSQPVEGGFLEHVDDIAPYSVSPLRGGSFIWYNLAVSPTLLENDFLRVELNAAGDIVRLYDKEHERQLLPPGAVANQFQAFEDRPNYWDAWDIEMHYADRMWLAEPAESVRVVEDGPLRAAIEIKRRVLHSTYTQRISLTHYGRRLDFHTRMDWQERHILLKVAFPVEVLSPTATYEVQWGHVERPSHRNTSWDWAKFETCAHKWVDLSEGDYGVSLLNDCKYGHDIQDQTPHGSLMRLSLLRGSTNPDPLADLGEHEFTYSLLPHHGRVGTDTIAQAYALNNPPFAFHHQGANEPESEVEEKQRRMFYAQISSSLMSVDRPNVIIETVKRAEDGNGLIVRLYESQRRRGPATLQVGFSLQAAWRTNLLEENQEELVVEGDEVRLTVRPFQIITLRLLPARE